MGFNLIKRELSQKAREKTSTFALSVQSFVKKNGKTFVTGTLLPEGDREVMITPAAWWSKDFQAGFERLRHALRPGAVMVFSNCERLLGNEYQAGSYRTITRGPDERYFLLKDQDVRIGPLITKPGGDHVQTVQWAVASESTQVRSSEALLERAKSVLADIKIGHPGAVVRGVDDQGMAMAVLIKRPWDIRSGRHVSVEEAIGRFLSTEEINVSGIGIRTSAQEFLSYIDRFPDATWEVMPLSSMTKKNSDDISQDYRFHPNKSATGFMKTMVAGSLDSEGRYRVRAVYPTQGSPLPLAYLPTSIAAPEFLPALPAEPQPEPRKQPQVRKPEVGPATHGLDALIAPKSQERATPASRMETPTPPARKGATAPPEPAAKPKSAPVEQAQAAPADKPSRKPVEAAPQVQEDHEWFDEEIDINALNFADEPEPAAPETKPEVPSAEHRSVAGERPQKQASRTQTPDEVEAATALDDDVDENAPAFGDFEEEDDLTLASTAEEDEDDLSTTFSAEELSELEEAQSTISQHLM